MEYVSHRAIVGNAVALQSGELSEAAASGAIDAEVPVIVVGGGPSGLRVAQELARRGVPVVLFNAERWRPYNRVQLTPFLAGEVQIGRVYQENVFSQDARVIQYNGQTIVEIDRATRTVVTQFGRRWRYAKLVLCLGSRAYIPPIPGRELAGVYRFRNFDDVELLVARAVRSRRTAVIGGGLLGLEAARGMALRKVHTTVVEHEAHLMARQLDHAGGVLLEEQIRRIGLDVRTGVAVKAIEGDGRVERIQLAGGETIDCDTVIICTGIRSNIELAQAAGIAVGRGITVDAAMQTSDPHVYAVGECAEHEGHVYGLVAPGLEQANVAAAHIAGEELRYYGSVPTTKLKVVGSDIFSMGDVEQIDQRTDVRTIVWRDPSKGLYRRLVIRRWRLQGALGVGEWPEINIIQQAVRNRAYVKPWQALLFARTGRLYGETRQASVIQWPAAATVCNCTGITRGQLGDAIQHGAGTIEALMRDTGASSVCGSCRPLLQELVGGRVTHQPVLGAGPLAVASILAAMATLVALAVPSWPFSTSIEAGVGIDRFWLDASIKQITGFTLLGLSALVAILSLRKRAGWKWLGSYGVWRIVHAVLGTAALAVLFMHTGFRLGENLNQWLMICFLGIAALGSLVGIVTAREHAATAAGRPSGRVAFVWLHILIAWPLPVLLTLHVITTYAY